MCLYSHGQILGQVSCHSKKQHSMRPLTFLKSRQQKELGWGAAGKRHLEVISQGTFTLFSTEGCQKTVCPKYKERNATDLKFRVFLMRILPRLKWTKSDILLREVFYLHTADKNFCALHLYNLCSCRCDGKNLMQDFIFCFNFARLMFLLKCFIDKMIFWGHFFSISSKAKVNGKDHWPLLYA